MTKVARYNGKVSEKLKQLRKLWHQDQGDGPSLEDYFPETEEEASAQYSSESSKWWPGYKKGQLVRYLNYAGRIEKCTVLGFDPTKRGDSQSGREMFLKTEKGRLLVLDILASEDVSLIVD